MSFVRFEIEQAGCESCGALVRESLTSVLAIETLEIDEERDVAHVTARLREGGSVEAVERLLAVASGNTGHAYRVGPGSWREDS